jgi:hypothetical protein
MEIEWGWSEFIERGKAERGGEKGYGMERGMG